MTIDPCRCLCPAFREEHECTSELAYVMVINGNDHYPGPRELKICAPCMEAWRTQRAHRIISYRINLRPQRTDLVGRRL